MRSLMGGARPATVAGLGLAVLVLAVAGAWMLLRRPAPTGGPETGPAGVEEEGGVVMGAKIEHLGHASFRLSDGDKVAYIDPFKLDSAPHDATVVLVTHAHFDHCSSEDVAKAAGPKTVIVAPADCREALNGIGAEFICVEPGSEIEAGGVPVKAVAAYNTNKKFHPKANAWVGYVVAMAGETIYHAGDTDVIPEMEGLAPDVALLPVGGTYTMTADEAAEAFRILGAKRGIPMHFGSVAGSQGDADRFLELVGD